MTVDDLIRFYKTQGNAGRKLGTPRPTISVWKKRGFIPAAAQALIQVRTRGRLKVGEPFQGPMGEPRTLSNAAAAPPVEA